MDGCEECSDYGNLHCEKDSNMAGIELRRVNMESFLINPDRYELRKGTTLGAPNCPFGNNYRWIGFDRDTNEYIRFTTSVFKKLVKNL